jgi:hypothetical protein
MNNNLAQEIEKNYTLAQKILEQEKKNVIFWDYAVRDEHLLYAGEPIASRDAFVAQCEGKLKLHRQLLELAEENFKRLEVKRKAALLLKEE